MNLVDPERLLSFETERIAAEWKDTRLDPLARAVLLDGAAFAFNVLGWPFHLMCVYRTPEEDKALGGTGIHVCWRALDVRTRDRKDEDVAAVVAYLAGRWVYDSKRPTKTVIYTGEHGTGPHAHVQSHPTTKRRATIRDW
jgi:hypothetical protein